jgi:hypothetical protein
MFAKVADGVWTPGIGDPTMGGWLTVLGYLAATWMALAVARRMYGLERGTGSREQTGFWLICGLLLLFLGINKQLDLQTGMTWLFKQWALAQGWYEQRRAYQALFIAGVAMGGAGFLGLLLWMVRRQFHPNWLAFAGMVFLVCFVLIRASSFHHVDRLLGLSLGGLKLNWILEWSGIACVTLGARRVLIQTRSRSRAENGEGKSSELGKTA